MAQATMNDERDFRRNIFLFSFFFLIELNSGSLIWLTRSDHHDFVSTHITIRLAYKHQVHVGMIFCICGWYMVCRIVSITDNNHPFNNCMHSARIFYIRSNILVDINCVIDSIRPYAQFASVVVVVAVAFIVISRVKN